MIKLGEPVVYVLSGEDAAQINRRRTSGASIAERISKEGWPIGAQAHIGNAVAEGHKFPGVVVSVNDPDSANLQVFLDGNDVFWATSRHFDGGKSPLPGTWARG
jgi:hypothetical protein